MQLTMPSNDQNVSQNDKVATKASQTLTIYVCGNDKVYYVHGLPAYDDPTRMKETTWGSKGLRKVLIELQTEMLPGRPMYIGGVSYWIPDLSKLRATVANTLDVKISPDLRSATQREMLEYENSVPDDAQEIPMDEATMHKLGLDRYNEDIDSAQSKDKKHSSSKEKYTEDKEDLSDPYRDEEDTRGSKIPDKEPREII